MIFGLLCGSIAEHGRLHNYRTRAGRYRQSHTEIRRTTVPDRRGCLFLCRSGFIWSGLLALAPFQVRWLQSLPGHSPELWGLDTGSTSARLSVSDTRGDPASNHIVLAVGVSASIEEAAADYLRQAGLKPRVCLYAEPEGGPLRQGQCLSGSEGLSLALQAVDALRDAKDKLRMKTAEVHLFLACPVAMAMLIGQKLNTFAMCHLYEHAPDRSPAYVKVHAFNPSAYSYA